MKITGARFREPMRRRLAALLGTARALRLPDEWARGVRQGLLLGAAVLVLVLPQVPVRPPAERGTTAATTSPRQLDMNDASASTAVLQLAQWVVDQRDNGNRAFAILDKQDARVFVFEASGKLRGTTPVLLGYARGDHTVSGIGQRPIADVRPEERTTPAGRFDARPGRNALNEEVLWVDYDAAVSMHRVRLTDPRERRLERLESPLPSERRISYGCINLPVAFFEQVLWPAVARHGGVVYVLPETRALTEVFPALALPPTKTPLSLMTLKTRSSGGVVMDG